MKLTKKALSLVLAIALLVTLVVIPAQATGNTVNGFTAYATGGLVGGTTYDTNITLSDCGGTDRVMVTGRGSTMGVYSEKQYYVDGMGILYSVESWIGGGDHWYCIALTENYGEWFENDGSDKALFFQFAYSNGNVVLTANYIGNGVGWTGIGTSQGVAAAGGQYSILLQAVTGGYSVYMKNASEQQYTLQSFNGTTVLSSAIVDGLFSDGAAYLTAGAYVATYDQSWSFVLGVHGTVPPVTVNGFTNYAIGGLVGGTTYDPDITVSNYGGTDRVLVTGRGGTNYGDTAHTRSTMGVYSEAKYDIDGLEILYSVENWIQSGNHWYCIALTDNYGEWFENDGSDKALFFMFAYNNGYVTLNANYIGNGAGWTNIGTSQGVPAAGGQYSIYLRKASDGYRVYMKNASQYDMTLQSFGGVEAIPASIVEGLFTGGDAYLTAGAYVESYTGSWSFVLGAHEDASYYVPLPVNGFIAFENGGLVNQIEYSREITVEDLGTTDRVKVAGYGGTNYGDTTKTRSTMGVYSLEKYDIEDLEILYSVEDWVQSGNHWYAIALTDNYGEWFEDDGSDKALFFMFRYDNGNIVLDANYIGNGNGWSSFGTSQGVPAVGGQYRIYLDKVSGGYNVYMKNAEQSSYTLMNFSGTTLLPTAIVDGMFPNGDAYLMAGAYVQSYLGRWSFILGAHEAAALDIKSASVTLDEDIDVTYAVEVPAGYTNPYMVINGTTISNYTVADGKLCFTYTGITPQRMTDNISATLYATKDGATVSDTVATYSVKQYCANLLAAHPNDAALVTLLSDLLTYGAAAQNYTGYKTNDLATSGLTLSPSTFTAISGKSVTFTGTADTDTYWSEATLVLGNTVGIRLYFYTDAQISIEVTINNSTQTYDSGFVSCGNGRYYLDIPGIEATDFDTTVSAAFYDNGAQVGNTLGYTVNTYICGTQNTSNTLLRALVRALYNYGASAAAYAAE